MPTLVTHTIGVGKDYADPLAWYAAEAKDFVAADETVEVVCDAAVYDFGSSILDLSTAMTVDATRRVKFMAASGAEHLGVSRENGGTGVQFLSSAICVRNRQGHIDFQDIEITSSASRSYEQTTGAATDTNTMTRVLITTTDTSTSSTSVVGGSGPTVMTWNNVGVIANHRRPMDVRSWTSFTANDCGILGDASVGILAGVESTFTNTLAFGFPAECWEETTPNGNNNAASDGTATTAFTASLDNLVPGDQLENPGISPDLTDWTLKAGNSLAGAGAGGTDIGPDFSVSVNVGFRIKAVTSAGADYPDTTGITLKVWTSHTTGATLLYETDTAAIVSGEIAVDDDLFGALNDAIHYSYLKAGGTAAADIGGQGRGVVINYDDTNAYSDA